MRITNLPTTLLLAASLLTASYASAHGIWLEERRGSLEVVYGHGSDDAYPTSKFHGAWGFDKNGKKVTVQTIPLETHVRLLPKGDAAVIASSLDNGYYTQKADKTWVNKGRSEVADAISSGNYWKYNLAVLQKGAKIPSNLSELRLAVIPETDPTVLKAGDTLPVRVLLDGKPLAGVKITEDYRNMDHVASFETDKDGRAEVVVRNGALNVIAASYTLKLEGHPDADKIGMESTLSFVAAN